MPGSLIQYKENSVASLVGTMVVQSMTMTSGNSVIVGVQCKSTDTPTITDSQGNAYSTTAIVSATAYAAGLQLFYAQSIVGGPNQITATNGSFNGLLACEFSGINLFLYGNGQNQNGPGTSADAISSNTINVLNLPAFLFGISFNSTGSGNADGAPNAGTGFSGINPLWANIGNSGQTVARAEYQQITGYGNAAATFTTNKGSDLFITVGAVFLQNSASTNTAPIAWTK